MKIYLNENGLPEFEVDVVGKNKSCTLKGLIDTGSTDCACLFKVITTLQIKPVEYTRYQTLGGISRRRTLVYDVMIGYEDHLVRVPIIRVQEMPEGIDVILGMSFLQHSVVTINEDNMEIEWKET